MERTVSANGLAADAQLQKNRFVALWARISQVSQKPATLGNQGQQPLAGAMILFVRLEMLRQHRDSGAQQGNLYFWRPGVGFVALIPGENLLLCFNRQCHSRGNAPCLLLISLWYGHHNTTGGAHDLRHTDSSVILLDPSDSVINRHCSKRRAATILQECALNRDERRVS